MLLIPRGQPISLDTESCDPFCQIIPNANACGFIQNPDLSGAPDGWGTLNANIVTTDPFRGSSIVGNNFEVNQTVNIPVGCYTLFYSYTRNIFPVTQTDEFLFQGTAFIGTIPNPLGDSVITGSLDFVLATPATLAFIFRVYGDGIQADVTFDYLYICDKDLCVNEPFCFQVCTKSSGLDLHEDDEICFDQTVTDTNPGAFGVDLSAGAPFGHTENLLVSTPVAVTANYCVEYSLTYFHEFGFCDASTTPGSTLRAMFDPTFDECLDESLNTAKTYTFKKVMPITALGVVSLDLITDSEDDGGTERIKYAYSVVSIDITPLFTTFIETLEVGFYRLCLDLEDYNEVRIIITRQVPLTVVFDKTYTGVLSINDILFFGNAGDYEIRFEVEECQDDPCVRNFKLDKLCTITDQLLDCDGNFIQLADRERVTFPADIGLTYSEVTQLCYDFSLLDEGCYQIELRDQFNTFLTNDILVCDTLKGGFIKLSWTHENIKCVGDCIIDGINYALTQVMYIRAELQDALIEDDRETYELSTGFVQIPFAKTRTIKTLQTEPLPLFLRQALATAITGTFFIDGVAHQKITDDDFTPQFTTVFESPLRVLVHEVGDFLVSKNC